jgi:transcriptional regulator with XRE-family HTH domain
MDEATRQKWAENLRARRKSLKLSQEQAAEICGLDQSTISRLERCQVWPSDELKWKLAGGLRTTVEKLFPYPSVCPPAPVELAS